MFFPTWEASSITDVTWSNRLCSTTFVRWLNVMSCLCYFSLSQLLGTRVSSSTQWDTNLPTAGDITYYRPRHPQVILWGVTGWGPVSVSSGPAQQPLPLRNPKHVKHLATGIQWFIVLSRWQHICLLHRLDGNFWLRFSSEMWHRM